MSDFLSFPSFTAREPFFCAPVPSRRGRRDAVNAATRLGLLCGTLGLMVLAGCGGGDNDATQVPPAADAGTAATLQTLELRPGLHLAALVPPEPDLSDADGSEASALRDPTELPLPDAATDLPTGGLDPASLQQALSAPANGSLPDGRRRAQGLLGQLQRSARMLTPAQIRAAYGLPALADARAAQLGAGQTLYLINAYHHPDVAGDLAVFSQRFGLPDCPEVELPPDSPLPLAAAAGGRGCQLLVLQAAPGRDSAGAAGQRSRTLPEVRRVWATESALDVQWAHAIAPHARLVLIEAASSSAVDLMTAVALATRLGPGVVNMSFSTGEFSLAAMQQIGAPFDTAAMSFVASAGDRGSASNWPAADPRVLAVTGTRLSWLGRQRIETAWSSTGGATSQQVPEPTYQAGLLKPGDPATPGAVRWRGSADVAFNADPYTGQYIYMTPSESTGGSGWSVAGGTSIAAVQWSGLLTLANALRAERALAPLGAPHARLYQAALGASTRWQAAFLDITAGRNGDCGAMCKSAPGYDLTSGLGSPRVAGLLELLAAP
jgi:hypothetical protein